MGIYDGYVFGGVAAQTGYSNSGSMVTAWRDPVTGQMTGVRPQGYTGGTGGTVSSQAVTAPTPIAAPTRQLTPQEQMNEKYRTELQAYTQKDPSGGMANNLQQLMSGTFSPTDPSYNWRFTQGQQAVERSGAAKGLLNSGNAAIELQQYGQGAASQEYGAQFNRTLQALQANETNYQSGYTRLAELAGMTPGQQTSAANLNLGYDQLATQASTANQQLNLGYSQLGQQASYQTGLLGLEGQKQQFAQQTANNTDSAFQQFLSQMTNPYSQTGNSGGNQNFSSMDFSSPISGYSSGGGTSQETNPDFYGVPSGQGYFTSSSGGSGTLGGYSGDLYY